ncbi:hypothetical protein J1605_014364, partial [Eschrichtius robustus]
RGVSFHQHANQARREHPAPR